VEQAINLWAFPLGNGSFIIIIVFIVLIHGVNGKARVEKYEDNYQARILMIFIIQD